MDANNMALKIMALARVMIALPVVLYASIFSLYSVWTPEMGVKEGSKLAYLGQIIQVKR